MSPATPRELLARFHEAMLAFSPDALAALFSVDALYEFPFLAPQREARRYEGREEIRAGFTRAWGALPEPPIRGFRDVRVDETTDPEVIVAEQEFDAINTATGARFSSGSLLILRSRDGQIVHARDYADVLSVSRGLGRLPELLNSLREETPSYALSEVSARDPEALEQYRDRAASSIAAHGGRYLIRGGKVEPVEGRWPERQAVVLVEFPSRECLQRWYESTEYAQALAVRDRALDRRLLFLDGANPTWPHDHPRARRAPLRGARWPPRHRRLLR